MPTLLNQTNQLTRNKKQFLFWKLKLTKIPDTQIWNWIIIALNNKSLHTHTSQNRYVHIWSCTRSVSTWTVWKRAVLFFKYSFEMKKKMWRNKKRTPLVVSMFRRTVNRCSNDTNGNIHGSLLQLNKVNCNVEMETWVFVTVCVVWSKNLCKGNPIKRLAENMNDSFTYRFSIDQFTVSIHSNLPCETNEIHKCMYINFINRLFHFKCWNR